MKNITEEPNVFEMWWRYRSKLEKRLIIASIVSGVSLILILFVYLLLPYEPPVCTTSTCVRTSIELLNYMDIRLDPCDDFYTFSCGNFIQGTNLDNRVSRSVMNVIEDEIQSEIRNMLEQPVHLDDPIAFNLAKKFYRACMNESAIEAEGLKGMKQIFKQIGGWPILNENNWVESQFDWKDAVYKFREIGINFEFFLILSLQRDKTDPHRYILNIGDPLYRPSQISNKVKKLYLDYMVDVAVLMGANKQRARIEQNDVMQFLLNLAKISEEAEAVNGSFNPLSLSELQYAHPDIPWLEFINNILTPANHIYYDDVISLSQPLYIEKLLKLLKNTKKRTIANFICWHTVQNLINYLPKKIINRAYEYLANIHGKIGKNPRWNICANATESKFNTVISAAYLDKYFDGNTRDRAVSMIRNIKQQFRNNIYSIEWLDNKAKEMVLEQLATSVEEMPSFHDLISQQTVYDKVEIIEVNLLTSVLNLDYANANIKYGKLRQTAIDNFFTNPGTVTGINLLYSSEENVLRVPVGIFQGIFYQTDRPEYMNYGVVGSVIAHKIYHIITEGKYKNSNGELKSWWSSHSLLNYEQKRQCVSNHYGKFIISRVEEQHLNATNSQDEEMADLAGLKVSYDTYINYVQEIGSESRLPGLNYSPNQLFWISSALRYCSKHSNETVQMFNTNYEQSPVHIRVNAALQNIDEFATDFGCALGTKMNPEDKCKVW